MGIRGGFPPNCVSTDARNSILFAAEYCLYSHARPQTPWRFEGQVTLGGVVVAFASEPGSTQVHAKRLSLFREAAIGPRTQFCGGHFWKWCASWRLEGPVPL